MFVRVWIPALIATMLVTSGCANTIRGAGRDIANTADAIGDSARRVTRRR